MFEQMEAEKPGLFSKLFSKKKKKKKTEEDENFKEKRAEILLKNVQHIRKQTKKMSERKKMYEKRQEKVISLQIKIDDLNKKINLI